MQQVATLGIDAAKNLFQLHGVDAHGKVVLKKQLVRHKVLAFVAALPPCLIGLEASGSAHYWARELTKLGHTVQLISPQFVKPYVHRCRGICERESPAPASTSRRTARYASPAPHSGAAEQGPDGLVNQIRGLLAEYGIVMPKRVAQVRHKLPSILEDAENGLTMMAREWLQALAAELQALDQRIQETTTQIQREFASHEACRRLAQLEGVGPLIATALVADVGEATTFKTGREFAAWLGLVPWQHSTGGKPLLLGISKRGDRYLRKLLIHGARAVVRTVEGKQDGRSRWLQGLIVRQGKHRAGVAQANKTARIAWVVVAKGERYRPAA